MWDMELGPKEWETEVQWLGLVNTSINLGSDEILYYLTDYQLHNSESTSVLNQEVPRHEDIRVNGGLAPPSLTSAPDGGERWDSRFQNFSKGKGPSVSIR
jgi:hypothetical protein